MAESATFIPKLYLKNKQTKKTHRFQEAKRTLAKITFANKLKISMGTLRMRKQLAE